MIPVPAGTRVWLASGVTDMRNYVETVIMRSLASIYWDMGRITAT